MAFKMSDDGGPIKRSKLSKSIFWTKCPLERCCSLNTPACIWNLLSGMAPPATDARPATIEARAGFTDKSAEDKLADFLATLVSGRCPF
eukprot:6568292-Prymnesium_polylepis.1